MNLSNSLYQEPAQSFINTRWILIFYYYILNPFWIFKKMLIVKFFLPSFLLLFFFLSLCCCCCRRHQCLFVTLAYTWWNLLITKEVLNLFFFYYYFCFRFIAHTCNSFWAFFDCSKSYNLNIIMFHIMQVWRQLLLLLLLRKREEIDDDGVDTDIRFCRLHISWLYLVIHARSLRTNGDRAMLLLLEL